MKNIYLTAESSGGIGDPDIEKALNEYFGHCANVKNILVIPPDISRFNSYAGTIVGMLYKYFQNAEMEIMPALGTHVPMSGAEIAAMYGPLPAARFIVHDWRKDTLKIGEVPGEFVDQISDGYMKHAIDMEVNKRLLDKKYDLMISVGQVVPHEVAGFGNYTKNIMVGCGGWNVINQSHYLAALYGMERIMGRADTPSRKLYNYGCNQFLSHLPLVYILTVTTLDRSGLKVQALSIGKGDDLFFKTAEVSREKNLAFLDTPVKKAVVYLSPHEFKTTWIGNKAVYRTRMAIADGGELLIIAPGLHGCGEDAGHDRLIKKYGYLRRDQVLEAVKRNEDLRNNLSVAAHLIHGSSEGRFSITYAPGKMSRDEVLSIKYGYRPMNDALQAYPPDRLKDGWNRIKGEEIFYVSNPSLGLWTTKSRFDD